ncbi:hypothetical protein PAMP_001897 [Pampus punctatissimus]
MFVLYLLSEFIREQEAEPSPLSSHVSATEEEREREGGSGHMRPCFQSAERNGSDTVPEN